MIFIFNQAADDDQNLFADNLISPTLDLIRSDPFHLVCYVSKQLTKAYRTRSKSICRRRALDSGKEIFINRPVSTDRKWLQRKSDCRASQQSVHLALVLGPK